MDPPTFRNNLEALTNTVKAAGCTPILVTSLCRRTFSGGQLKDILAPFADQTIAVGKKLNVPVLPLLADSRAYVAKLGSANANQFNFVGEKTTGRDTTHLNALGSKFFGRMVADEMKKAVPALAANIKADAVTSGKIAAGTL
ncbi:hypothetical protein H0H81_012465 [Sphagnurus paluster]|uniref:SGNH hydrolase-type esterase domain-containing protein n=1 Tax=Sphagnurus paluster TaxID=117069 RepID=A0A9P7FND8_9AGAR|nr:hypothetical protein H0H81_012465 [Sphagnurus paluster]